MSTSRVFNPFLTDSNKVINFNFISTAVILWLLFTTVATFAARERNYIYLFDCTKSMKGFGGAPNIFLQTKDYLETELKKHSDGTTLHVIPFQDKVLTPFNFKAEDLDQIWKEIDDSLTKNVNNITRTNICDAWDTMEGYIDLHKDNYIILLTDGIDNVKGMDEVGKKLRDWCGKYPNTWAFYVQLTEAAIDQNVKNIIDLCNNERIIDAREGIPVFGHIDENDTIIYANTLNLQKKHTIGISSAGRYSAKAICNNPYFNIQIVDNKIEDGILSVKIGAKMSLSQINASIPQTYCFTFDVQSDEVSIINPTIEVRMTNKKERSLEIMSEESSMGQATWYDSFLFWGASSPDTLSIDLKAVFSEEAISDNSIVQLQIKDSDGGEKDFLLLFNNQPIENDIINLQGNDNTSSILSVVYNSGAKEGNRYLTITPVSMNGLDKINDQPVNNYNLTLRSTYQVYWNPLKTFLMWLSIIIAAALLLWFLIIKHFVYPSIGVKTIQINDPYFSRINIKGKRRIVFSNKDMKQSLLNRIFTGKIIYKKNDIWTSPLTFEPGTKKKTLKVLRNQDYSFDSFPSTLKAPNDYVIENNKNKTKINITLN